MGNRERQPPPNVNRVLRSVLFQARNLRVVVPRPIAGQGDSAAPPYTTEQTIFRALQPCGSVLLGTHARIGLFRIRASAGRTISAPKASVLRVFTPKTLKTSQTCDIQSQVHDLITREDKRAPLQPISSSGTAWLQPTRNRASCYLPRNHLGHNFIVTHRSVDWNQGQATLNSPNCPGSTE